MHEQDLFLAASEIDAFDDRDAFLERACSGDSRLLRRMKTLLAAHGGSSSFLRDSVLEQLGKGGTTVNLEAVTTDGDDANRTDTLDSERTDGEGLKCGGALTLGFLAPSTRPGSLGRLSNYEVQEVLGRGAFGIVLKAFDDMLHRMVAIKVMSAELSATSSARKRFLREARASAAVRHEHVVNIYSVDEQPIPHLVMEYVPGQTLQQRIDERGPLEVTDILKFGKQIASGLAAAHAIGLIHRDIKPANIMLESGASDRVKITDFGLARAADDASVTQVGVIAGTPMYMAPEQALGGSIDQRADLFSLGSVLYLMATGKSPFQAPNTIAVLKRVTEETPQAIQELQPAVPEWLCAIISRLHAKQPNDRFGSAAELSAVLDRCLTDIQRGVIPSPSGFLVAPATASPGRQNRNVWTAASILILVATFIGISWSIRSATVSAVQKSPSTTDGQSNLAAPVAINVPIELGPLFNGACMGSGPFSDVAIKDNVLIMDVPGRGRDLWINFEDIAGDDLTIETQFRILNPEREGYAKLIFMPHEGQEAYAMIGNPDFTYKVWIDQDRSERQFVDIPPVEAGEWNDLKFVVSGDQFSFIMNGKTVIQMARGSQLTGFVCLASGGWQCEFKHPQAIVHKAASAN